MKRELEERMDHLITPDEVERWLKEFKNGEKFEYNPYWTFEPFYKELKQLFDNIYRFRNTLLKKTVIDNSAVRDCDVTHVWEIITIDHLKQKRKEINVAIRHMEEVI